MPVDAGLVCGGCAPLMKDLLRRPDFTPANLVSIRPLGPAVPERIR
jgi:NAD(P)H-nitrite reductase large subunit